MPHAPSSSPTVAHRSIGDEGHVVVVVENVFADPDGVVASAAEASFCRINPYYPGVRAAVSDDIDAVFRHYLRRVGVDAFAAVSEEWAGEAWHSLVTLAPGELAPIQRLPHYDGVDPNLIAVLAYLHHTPHGGTNFFRHNDTGYESITADRFDRYKRSLEAGVRAAGLPPARYLDDGAPLFTKIASFEPRYNSMIIYRGCALHSGAIRNDAPLSGDPVRGRLTVNGFYRAKA